MRYLKITIITVVFNSVEYIEETIKSVLDQNYPNLEYIVIDGGSSDGTLEILDKYKSKISILISEPDNGMYDALSKGFAVCSGEVVGYINSGDFLYKKSLFTLDQVFKLASVNWVTGYRTLSNNNSVITRVDLPFRYLSILIKNGFYGRYLPYIQQESTFWRGSLLNEVNLEKLSKFKLAGDYFIWWTFSDKYNIDVLQTPLGVFKRHKGQLSESLNSYWAEVKTFAVPDYSLKAYIILIGELILWSLSERVLARLFKNRIYFNYNEGEWKLR